MLSCPTRFVCHMLLFPHVPRIPRALVLHMLFVLPALVFYVPRTFFPRPYSTYSLPYVPLVLNALVAHVSHTLRVLMFHVSHVLLALLLLAFSALPGIVPHVLHVSGNLYPMYSRAL